LSGYITSPQRPKAHIYDNLDSDDYDVTFGIDLRKWGGQQGWKAIMRKEATEGTRREMIPPVLTALLQGLEQKYKDVPDDGSLQPVMRKGSTTLMLPAHSPPEVVALLGVLERDLPLEGADQ
jgi:hypothetical protein